MAFELAYEFLLKKVPLSLPFSTVNGQRKELWRNQHLLPFHPPKMPRFLTNVEIWCQFKYSSSKIVNCWIWNAKLSLFLGYWKLNEHLAWWNSAPISNSKGIAIHWLIFQQRIHFVWLFISLIVDVAHFECWIGDVSEIPHARPYYLLFSVTIIDPYLGRSFQTSFSFRFAFLSNKWSLHCTNQLVNGNLIPLNQQTNFERH